MTMSVAPPSKSKRPAWNNPFKKNLKGEPQMFNPPFSLSNTDTNQPHEAQQLSLVGMISPLSSVKKSLRKVEIGHEAAAIGYGYEDAEPDKFANIESYGYDDDVDALPGNPISQLHEEPRRYLQRRSSMPCSTGAAPRRSSMKQVGGTSSRESMITCKGEIEVFLPPSKKGEGRQKITRRTSLTFNEETTITPIEPAKNLARSPEDLWFQDHEMQQIRRKVSALVSRTEDGLTPHNGKRYCMRGLERLMEPQVVAVKRSQAWDTVFKEQYLQQCEGIFEEDHLANLYKFSTLRSKKDATARASEDAKEIENYLRLERRMYRRMSM